MESRKGQQHQRRQLEAEAKPADKQLADRLGAFYRSFTSNCMLSCEQSSGRSSYCEDLCLCTVLKLKDNPPLSLALLKAGVNQQWTLLGKLQHRLEAITATCQQELKD